jgi:cyclophilin family peptidyl-prolyl cis-trans isomerase
MQPSKRAYRIAAAVPLLGMALPAWSTEVSVCTDLGSFTVELFDEQAPQHVVNFLAYVEQGFYSGTVFHRVVAGFVVQGGGFDRTLRERETREPVPNESRNGLSNARGTVAAARTEDPNSATSQFYINLADNIRLDASEANWGYTVFGRVTTGMETLDTIGKLPTAGVAPFPADVPEPLVAVSSMAVLDRAALEALPEDSRIETIRQEIVNASTVDDSAHVLEWVRHYRAACAPADPDVLLSEAKAALSSDDVERARYVLDDFFAVADSSHPSYVGAAALAEILASIPAASSHDDLFARCEIPEAPSLPSGAVDSRADMVEGQAAVRTFITASEMYLDCLTEVIDTQELSDRQRAQGVEAHNQMVSRMEQLAEDFNEQVRIFKAREE